MKIYGLFYHEKTDELAEHILSPESFTAFNVGATVYLLHEDGRTFVLIGVI